ncbi:HpcH/HpaI aldolase family protein [Rhodococcus opacus]|uniref:HpcH/HpaI aldolase family protein n=1 Tax=Rhodococcus opacus TaxID=37919 RepID=UPI0003200FB0|nr:aldolase/citrate lyase family protein [Rhodococcus opacus]AHK34239.1 5-keto-4-deoxy-D-glucarate aldolase [Rhodococcus opacus PD630]UDG96429.1 aldolase [Rhodococcus opacus PD630]
MHTLQHRHDLDGHVTAVTLDFPTPGTAEFLAHNGFAAIAIDFEHSNPDWNTVENIVRACELTEATVIARVPHSPELVANCLDLGIAHFQLAHVDTAQQVEKILDCARFAPRGTRGIGRSRANRFGHYPGGYQQFRHVAESVSLIVHIESLDGIASLPDLIAIDEVRIVLVGAQDLAASMGHIGRSDHPEVQSAIDRIIDTVRTSGKAIGMSASSPTDAAAAAECGATFLLASQARLMSGAASVLHSALDRSPAVEPVAGGTR